MSKLGYSRSNPRVERVTLVNAKRYHESGELADLSAGRTLNISEGGILLEVVEAAPFMAKVSLSIGLGDNVLNMVGEVTHLHKNTDNRVEMGLKFLNLSDEDLEKLKNYIY